MTRVVGSLKYNMALPMTLYCKARLFSTGVATGGGVYRYIYPQNQSTLKNLCGCSSPVTQDRFDTCPRVGH